QKATERLSWVAVFVGASQFFRTSRTAHVMLYADTARQGSGLNATTVQPSLYIDMFGSNPKPTPTTPATTSNGTHQSSYSSAQNRVSSGVSITGDVKFGSELLIDGEVQGNITSNGKLTIGTH